MFCNKQNIDGVSYKHCVFDKCLKAACFGYQMHGKAIYCGTHRLKTMINVQNKRRLYDECIKISSYGYEGCKAD